MSLFAAAAFTAVGASLGGYGASSRNSAIESAMQANNAAAAAELAQQDRIAALQRMRSRRNAERVFGLISTSAAERGVGMGGSVAALDRTASADESLNLNAMDIERYGAQQRTLSGLNITNSNLASQGQSIAMGMLTGALQGVQTGLSIGQGIQGLSSGGEIPGLDLSGGTDASIFMPNDLSFPPVASFGSTYA